MRRNAKIVATSAAKRRFMKRKRQSAAARTVERIRAEADPETADWIDRQKAVENQPVIVETEAARSGAANTTPSLAQPAEREPIMPENRPYSGERPESTTDVNGCASGTVQGRP